MCKPQQLPAGESRGRRASACVAARLAELAAAPPGPETVADIAAIDPAALDAGAKVDYLVTVEKVAAWVASLQQLGLSAIDVAADGEMRRPADFDDDWAREQVG